MFYLLISSVITGALLLALFAYQDFRSQIFKPWKVGRYYAGLFVFVSINLFIYLALCAFFLGIDVLQPESIIAKLKAEADPTGVLQPLILAFFYHATGMAPVFKLGGKDVNLYRLLLQSFHEFLKLKFASSVQIREAIAHAKAELKLLRDKATYLHSEAGRQKWDTLDDRWREMEDDLGLMDTQSEFLEALKRTVEKVRNDPKRTPKLDKIAHDIDVRIATIRQTQIDKLKHYLSEFVLMNFKDEKEIQDLLEELGAPHAAASTPEARFALRCMFVGLAFGLVFGPLYALTEGVSAVDYARFGALSLGVFGFVLGLARDLRRKPKDRLLRAIISGLFAGVAGYMTWKFATSAPNMFSGIEVGIAFGIALSLLVYVFRLVYYFGVVAVPAWMKSIVARFLLTALAGAGVFAGLGVAFNHEITQQSTAIVRLLILGVVVMWALAAGFRLFETPATARKS